MSAPTRRTSTRHPSWPRHQSRICIVGIVVAAATLSTLVGPPAVLANSSPSEPPGLYLRSAQAPRVGRIIAFRLPPAGLEYVDAAMPYLRTRSLLKAVAAGPGDWVCTRGGELVINGAHLAPVLARDTHGRSLPHWAGCRPLRPGELFVFSARVLNSFDSRYYGPVPRAAVLGVYRRLAAPPAGVF